MLRGRVKLILIVLLVAVGLGVGAGLLLPRYLESASRPLQIANTATLLRQVQSLSQLVTVKYVLEKVVILEDVKWYGESRVLLVAHGIVKAGVDLSQLNEKHIELSGTKVRIHVPMATVTDAYLDDQKTRVIERSTGMLRSFDKDLEQVARRQAVDDIRRAARASGIYEDADDRAAKQLQALFRMAGFTEIEVVKQK